MTRPEFYRDDRSALEKVIGNFPHLFVKRDSAGFVHVTYPHTTNRERKITISPVKTSPNPQKPDISILVYEYPSDNKPIFPSEQLARFMLKPVPTTDTYEVNVDKGDVPFEDVLRPVKQGFAVLEAFIANRPPATNPDSRHLYDQQYEPNVVDILGKEDVLAVIERLGMLDPNASMWLGRMSATLRGTPTNL